MLGSFMAGCESDTTDPKPSSCNPGLLKQAWHLESFGTVDEETPLLPGTAIWAIFGEGNRVEGAGGCNGYLGTYVVAPSCSLTVHDLMQTLNVCHSPDGVMEQEGEYLNALQDVSSFRTAGDSLQLFYDNGHKNLIFR
jgi:heat shock protein HslJ